MQGPRSPKLRSVEVVPRHPILWMSPAVVTLFVPPTELSACASFLGTMNNEMPFVPSGAPLMRASTRCTMFAVSS